LLRCIYARLLRISKIFGLVNRNHNLSRLPVSTSTPAGHTRPNATCNTKLEKIKPQSTQSLKPGHQSLSNSHRNQEELPSSKLATGLFALSGAQRLSNTRFAFQWADSNRAAKHLQLLLDRFLL
jgi:hypothetical protein